MRNLSLPDVAALPSPRVRFARSMAAHEPALRLYAIVDAESCARRGLDLLRTAEALQQGGVRLMQYRDKLADEATYLQNARALRALLAPQTFLLLNDYPHLVGASGADGAHVGQTDCAVVEARAEAGSDSILGVSTHSADQALNAGNSDVDYVAIGPVFRTGTKADAAPVVGLCAVQAARAVVGKPLVAIGGIGLGDARAVEMAGADSIAVISALLPSPRLTDVTQQAEDFLARLK